MLKVGSKIFCDDINFGDGEVIQIFNTKFDNFQDHYFLAKFTNRQLLTMCCLNDMITIFDDKKRKIFEL